MHWRPHRLTISIAIAIPLLYCFGALLFAARVPGYRDTAHFYYPLYAWTHACWAQGQVPLWNPQDNVGTPVAAEATSAVFYPGRILLALPLPYFFCFNLYLIGHVVLAVWGVAALSRELLVMLQPRRPAGGAKNESCAPPGPWYAISTTFSALAYVFSGTVLFQYCNLVFLVGAAWLPLALLGALRMLERRSVGWAVMLGVCLAMMVLGGDPQMAYHTGLLVALLAWLRRGKQGRREDSSPQRTVTAGRHHALVLLAIAALCGVLLSAVQIVPALELARVSERAGQLDTRSVAKRLFGPPPAGSHEQQVYDFSVAPWRLIECLWPNISGRLFPLHQRWLSVARGEDRVWTPTLYLGLFPLLIALTMWRRRRDSVHVRWLFWIMLGTCLASFGWYAPGAAVREVQQLWTGQEPTLPIGNATGGLYWLMVKVLPGYSYFRYPAKLLVIATLAASLLAGLGLRDALTVDRRRLAMLMVVVAVLSVAAALVVGVSGIWWPRWFADAPPNELFGPFDAGGARRGALVACAHALVMCGIGGWLLRRSHWSAIRLAHLVLLVTAVELAWANGAHVVSVPARVMDTPSVLAGIGPPSPTARDGAGHGSAPVAQAESAGRPLGGSPVERFYRPPQRDWVPAAWRTSGNVDRVCQTVAWDRAALFPKLHLLEPRGSLYSFNTMSHRDYRQLLRTRADDGPHPDVLRLLGARFLVLPADRVPAEAIERDVGAHAPDNVRVWECRDPLPRAWIVHDVQFWPVRETGDPQAARVWFEQLMWPDGQSRDFRRSAIVELRERARLKVEEIEVTESCHIVNESSNRIEIQATLAEPGLLVLGNQYDRGWTAEVSIGKIRELCEIVRTNGVMQGVFLPAGESRVVFRYAPRGTHVALVVSLLAWLACLAWGCYRLVARLS